MSLPAPATIRVMYTYRNNEGRHRLSTQAAVGEWLAFLCTPIGLSM